MGSEPLAVPQHSPNWQLMKSVCRHKLVGRPFPVYPLFLCHYLPITPFYYPLLVNPWQSSQIWSADMNGGTSSWQARKSLIPRI